jgi:RNA polymerase sigma-70 factor (ECF subfamily)
MSANLQEDRGLEALPHHELPEATPGTLGAVLYAGGTKAPPTEAEWVALVSRTGAGDQAALHSLYERANRLVFTLSLRLTGSRESAEEVTLDVFHDLWRRAVSYHPANGTVLGWIMNQARSRALDRVRFEQRKKRVDPATGDAMTEEAADAQDILELKEQGQAVRAALSELSSVERAAIEAAFFNDMTHAEVAARLNEPLGTVKTRIRSGLRKLRLALAAGKKAS